MAKPKFTKTLAQFLAEDPGLQVKLKAEGKWHKVNPAWADGSVPLPTDGLRVGIHPWAASPFMREVLGREPKRKGEE